MSANSRCNWFWSDWLGDQAVRRLTPAERGVWIDLLALAAAANPIGFVCDERGKGLSDAEICRITNAESVEETRKLLDRIVEKGAASRDRAGRLYNRRMVRENSVVANKRRAGKLGGAATRLKWQALSASPPDLLWQMPQHLKPPLSNKKERKKEQRGYLTASSLASARHKGALASSPNAEENQEKSTGNGVGNGPTTASRADLEALFAKRNGCG